MSELRATLIRIAYENPHLRDKILPVVTTGESMVKEAAKRKKSTKVTFIEAVLESPTDLTDWLSQQEGAPSITG